MKSARSAGLAMAGLLAIGLAAPIVSGGWTESDSTALRPVRVASAAEGEPASPLSSGVLAPDQRSAAAPAGMPAAPSWLPANGASSGIPAATGPAGDASPAPSPEPVSEADPAPSAVSPARPPGKVLHLTIDDGPSQATPAVLGILARHGVKATFFVIGEEAARHPGILARIRAEGHQIGNHTYTHPWLDTLTAAAIRQELARASAAIGGASCMRAPGGRVNATVRQVARESRLALVDWTADSRDWTRPGTAAIRRNIVRASAPGGIILIHDGGGDRSQTVAALDGVLSQLTKAGYRFAPLPQCR